MKSLICSALLLVVCNGCYYPYQEEIYFIVPPDSTVHLNPVQGGEDGLKIDTADLEKGQVYSRRIIIPTMSSDLGRGPGNFEYIPAVKPILTRHSPADRTWTIWSTKGSTAKNDAFHFESLDSVNFSGGGVIIARVKDSDAALYRSSYSGASLEVIVDKNVKPFLLSHMSKSFLRLNFLGEHESEEDCLNQTIHIYVDAWRAAQKFFGGDGEKNPGMGITIDYFGNVGGLHPDNPDNQVRLDRRFIEKINVLVQSELNRKTEVENRMEVSLARAQRKAADLRYQAKEAVKLRELFHAIELEQLAINNAAMGWGSVRRDPDHEGTFLGGRKGSLPRNMPANAGPLSWINTSSPEALLAGLPMELPPELVADAEQQLEEIERELAAHEAEMVKKAEHAAKEAEKAIAPSKKESDE